MHLYYSLRRLDTSLFLSEVLRVPGNSRGHGFAQRDKNGLRRTSLSVKLNLYNYIETSQSK